jgi:predicted metal-dependent HD superfamily phosphohydrolase
MNYQAAKDFILNKLKEGLHPDLTYHSIDHTLDVLESAERLAELEGIDPEELLLLRTACLYHDSGMLTTYRGHEEASVELVREILPRFGYSTGQIETIGSMIMNTKLPQYATNLVEKILCDADLDYLGRADFFMIAHRLKYEWAVLGILPTTLQEWYVIQKRFLRSHEYFTGSARKLRQEGKAENLRQIELILDDEN